MYVRSWRWTSLHLPRNPHIAVRVLLKKAVIFLVLIFFAMKTSVMFFTPRHISFDNFMQMTKLASKYLARLRLQDFKKVAYRCFIKHNNAFHTHLFTIKTYNNVLHTSPHNP